MILLFVAIELVVVAVALVAMIIVRSRAVHRERVAETVKRDLAALVGQMGPGAHPRIKQQAVTVLSALTKDHARRLLTEMAEYAAAGEAQVFEELYVACNLAVEARANAAARPWERLRVIREGRALNDPARLLERLVRDPEPDVRLGAFEVLCALGRADEAVIALPEIATDGRLNRVRAIDALSTARPMPVAELVPFAHAERAETRQVAVAALGLGHARAALDVMVHAVSDPDAEVRIQALKGLRELGDASALPVVLKGLDDECWEVRSEAARTAGTLGAAGSVDAIAKLLDDDAEWVRHNAAIALSKCGPAGITALRVAASRGNHAASNALAEARLTVVDAGTRAPPPAAPS
jgi:HEAT repeat protein